MTDNRPLRILLLGDYSNCHNTLATGLRQLGCDVTVASWHAGWELPAREIDLSRRPGRLGGIAFVGRVLPMMFDERLSGYDIVSIQDVNFLTLRPFLLRPLFDLLRRRNGAVFLSAMSTDIAYLDMVSAKDCPLKYSEWFIDGEPSPWMLQQSDKWDEWHASALVKYQRYCLSRIDGAVSVLYEYHLGMQRCLGDELAVYGGLPVDTKLYVPDDRRKVSDKIRLLLGRDVKRIKMKGTDLLETAARVIVDRHPDTVELVIVENRPFNEFVDLLRTSDIVLDQIYSYTPATTALMAMSMGLNVVTGGEDDYYDFIGEKDNRPIINAPVKIEGLIDTLENVVSHPQLLAERGRKSREFAVKHNDCVTVARRFLDFWLKRISQKSSC